MTVTVVPVLRLRRATTGWSYKVPTGLSLLPGAFVIVPFRNRATLGVVWDTEDNVKATQTVSEVLTSTPLVRAPHRALVEWLSEEGICSLSTALYVWLPASLRNFPLTKPVREALAVWDTDQPSSRDLALNKQHAVIVPSLRENAEISLRLKYKDAFQSTFADTTPAQEFSTWLAIARGTCHVATGRERALYAPWVNLRHITLIEPEDISYHTGQSPYLNLVDAASALATAAKAELTCRTNIPIKAAREIWPSAAGLPMGNDIELTDLKHDKILNPRLIERIKKTHAARKNIVILYNAHDRLKTEEDGTRRVIPGVETIAKQLAVALELPGLPASILLGTRSILGNLPRNIGLTVILSLDPLLGTTSFADKLHGWGDIGRLLQTQAPLLIQTWQPGHALTQAVVNGRFDQFCKAQIEEAKQFGIPPFAEEIVCALPLEAIADTTELRIALEAAAPEWQIGYPREALRRGKRHIIVTMNAAKGTRLPFSARKILAALARPWKVERGPWYAT
jgi:primosomal protein N'